MKAINIKWEVDVEDDLTSLPTEIEIPEDIKNEEDISDYISNSTGFLHNGFEIVNEDKIYHYYDLMYFHGRKNTGSYYVKTTISLDDDCYGDIDSFLNKVIEENKSSFLRLEADSICDVDEINEKTYLEMTN